MFPRRGGEEIIVAALKRRDRVAKVSLYETTSSAFQRFTAVMQEPLSALKELRLSPRFYLFRPELVLPETFLKGSAPSLQSLNLNGIAFPALSKFISFCQAHLTLTPSYQHPGYMGYLTRGDGHSPVCIGSSRGCLHPFQTLSILELDRPNKSITFADAHRPSRSLQVLLRYP